MNETNHNNDPQWFNDVITSYDYQSPKTGQIIEGVLIRLDDEGALIDIGVKRDAIVPARDLVQLDKDLLAKLEVGGPIMVYVTSPATGDRDLQVSISKAVEYQDWQAAETLLDSKESTPLSIVGYNRGGLIVQFNNLRGFLPFSQVPELRAANNPRQAETLKREMVGQTMDLKVIEVIPDRNRLIFSALEAQSEKRKKRIAALEKGQIIEGKVASVVDFGVFVDLDGIDGLVHISQLAWKKVKHPSDVVKTGETIQVKVTDIDRDKERISLSRKALLPSPWETINEFYHTGEYIEVTITRVVDFGAFARLDEGIEGLIHSSQVGYSSTQNLKEAIKSGDRVLVKILEINPERRRMALSMRQVPMEKQIAWAMDNLPEPPKPAPQTETPSSAEVSEPPKTEETASEAVDATSTQAVAAEDTQAEDTPQEAIAAEDTPAEDTSAEATSAEVAFAEVRPSEDTSAEDTPEEDIIEAELSLGESTTAETPLEEQSSQSEPEEMQENSIA